MGLKLFYLEKYISNTNFMIALLHSLSIYFGQIDLNQKVIHISLLDVIIILSKCRFINKLQYVSINDIPVINVCMIIIELIFDL